MEVSLPPDLQQFVTEKINQGVFASANEAVCQALVTMRDRQQREEELKHEIEIGLEQIRRGDVKLLDLDAMKAEARRRLAQRQGK
jgi:antitoxin ParD1/3/4